MKRIIEYILWIIIICGLGLILTNLIIPEPRYTCMICEKPQWVKGWQVSEIQEFICDECFVLTHDDTIKEMNYPAFETHGYEQMDMKFHKRREEKITGYLEDKK